MRNRYIVFVVMAVLAIVLVGCTRNPETAKRKYLESGLKYMDQKKYDAAVIQFKKALQIDPRYAEAHFQLANAQMDLQHYPEGYKELTQTVDLDPNHFKARLSLGGLLMSAHKFDKAEEQARYIIEHDPNNAEAYVLLGNALLAEKHRRRPLTHSPRRSP